MRPLPPIVVCTMLLLGLSATGSLADPSIVADLDSNATNGPDTLQMDLGDTVLVRVWITDSADSLLGFGITLGDTSGTLAWVEDDTDAVYTIPAAWMTVPVQVDEDGRLLLQGYDFTFSEPLHIPHQVAQLRFVAVSPESCAVFSWNTDLSGWQNWEFTEGTFASFEGAVVCVAGQQDGGGDEGEGGEDDAPSAGPYPCEPDLIEVMFAWDSRVRLRDGVLVDLESDATTGLDSILDALDWHSWRRHSCVAEEVLDEIHEHAERNLGKPVYSLNNIYRLHVPLGTDVWGLSRELETLEGVLRAAPVPLMPPLPSLPPDFEPAQRYLDAADSVPSGLDAEYSWAQPGGNGEGVTVCDIEACWRYSHADLSKAPPSQINPNTVCDTSTYSIPREHGTASIGVLVSDHNGWGTTGMCYGSSLLTCGVFSASGGDTTWNPAEAIEIAIDNLSPGDVILIEQQWTVSKLGRSIPIEWYLDSSDVQTENAVYVAVISAVGNGINVIEPGGNGNDDTGSLTWLEDSGAIIVGAGSTAPGNDLHRRSDSSYGTRFDLQGWGDSIVTTGRGDLYGEGVDDSAYSASYGRTSGAAATVAGAVADLVGFWRANVSEDPPSPDSVRSLLKRTGTAQVPDSEENIGPRPDLRRAFADLIEIGIQSRTRSLSDSVILQVVPSPLNATASVFVQVPAEVHVRLELFSPGGRLVRVLFDGDRS